jgi:hypothetical protein
MDSKYVMEIENKKMNELVELLVQNDIEQSNIRNAYHKAAEMDLDMVALKDKEVAIRFRINQKMHSEISK